MCRSLSTTDWIRIISTLVVMLTAIFAPYLADNFKRWRRKPKLRINFHMSPPMCRRASRISAGNPAAKVPTYEFHFEIENYGGSQAKNVEALLAELWRYDASGKLFREEDFYQARLRYDNMNTKFVDINKQRTEYWNLGYILKAIDDHWVPEHWLSAALGGEAGRRFYLDLQDFPFGQPNYFNTKTKYVIKVVIHSENADSVEKYFEIAWSGEWKEDDREMFKEIVITSRDSLPR